MISRAVDSVSVGDAGAASFAGMSATDIGAAPTECDDDDNEDDDDEDGDDDDDEALVAADDNEIGAVVVAVAVAVVTGIAGKSGGAGTDTDAVDTMRTVSTCMPGAIVPPSLVVMTIDGGSSGLSGVGGVGAGIECAVADGGTTAASAAAASAAVAVDLPSLDDFRKSLRTHAHASQTCIIEKSVEKNALRNLPPYF